jgi:hypothetical protein
LPLSSVRCPRHDEATLVARERLRDVLAGFDQLARGEVIGASTEDIIAR